MLRVYLFPIMAFSVGDLLGQHKYSQSLKLRSKIDSVTDNWAALMLNCLSMIAQRDNCVNVLVTTTQLVPALAKVMMFGLSQIFPIENIYSSTKLGERNMPLPLMNVASFANVHVLID